MEALEAGLSVFERDALVDLVNREDVGLERVLPLVAKHGAAVVAISNDESGISEDPNERFAVAKKIIETLLVIEKIPPSISKKEHLASKS